MSKVRLPVWRISPCFRKRHHGSSFLKFPDAKYCKQSALIPGPYHPNSSSLGMPSIGWATFVAFAISVSRLFGRGVLGTPKQLNRRFPCFVFEGKLLEQHLSRSGSVSFPSSFFIVSADAAKRAAFLRHCVVLIAKHVFCFPCSQAAQDRILDRNVRCPSPGRFAAIHLSGLQISTMMPAFALSHASCSGFSILVRFFRNVLDARWNGVLSPAQ